MRDIDGKTMSIWFAFFIFQIYKIRFHFMVYVTTNVHRINENPMNVCQYIILWNSSRPFLIYILGDIVISALWSTPTFSMLALLYRVFLIHAEIFLQHRPDHNRPMCFLFFFEIVKKKYMELGKKFPVRPT